jgi:hypothetical protein
MTHFIRMMVIAAGMAGLSTIADAGTHINAGWYNGVHLNAIGSNGSRLNAIGSNGSRLNAIGSNGSRLNAIGSNGSPLNALGGNAVAASGISAADGKAVQGLFVIGFKLPIR